MFIDEAIIDIEAGKGGNGAVSFRHEKYVAKGGPDGGDGGDGGDIVFTASNSIYALANYARLKQYKAENGFAGSRAKRHGKNGQDLILSVPPGTIFSDLNTNTIVADLKKEGESFVAVMGGKGGLGNVHFATSTNQTPHEFKPGEDGQKTKLKLELKLIADVGIIGLPNAGKSTLISAISNSKPKVADYPFTTLEPVLGSVKFDDKNIIFADIPGLIEGAHSGKGLGHKFLRHIERTKILLHLIDATSDNLERDYKTIRKELDKFSPKLSLKKEIVVLSKMDLAGKIKPFKHDLEISAATGKGIKELLQLLAQ